MQIEQFQQMVQRLESESAASPAAYRVKVALLAMLGFAILLLLLGAAGLGMLLLAGFAVALIYTGGGALLLLLKLGKLLVLLAVPLWFLVKSSLRALFIRLPVPQGRELMRAEAPVLFEAMDAMRRSMHGPRFHHVLIVDDVNAAVVQRPAFGLFGGYRNYLLLGLPMLEGMAPEEALAVVAHEYGHLAGSHGRFEAYIYRLRLTWLTLQEFANQLEGWLARAIKPVIGWYVPYFNAYTFVLARANEYQADVASVDLVGAAAASHALKRINLLGPRHAAFMERTFERIGHEPQPPADLSQRWGAEVGLPLPRADAQAWLANALDRQADVADTHPALRLRLGALPAAAQALDALPPELSGASSAEQWLGPLLPELRAQSQQQWAARVTAPWAERHAEIQGQRMRLEALRLQPQRTVDEELEKLRLQLSLEPDVDWREALHAFNAKQPDNAQGLYLEGVVCLRQGDESGLALLERSFAIEQAYIKPASEAAHDYLVKRQDARAQDWSKRWAARDAFEARRLSELRNLDVRHPVGPANLEGADMEVVRARLTPANCQHAAEIYLVRRILPIDAGVMTCILAVRMTWWGRRLGRQQKVVDRLAALQWPVHLVVCTLEGEYKALAKAIAAVEGARLV